MFSRKKTTQRARRQLNYRRFDTLAEAVRFAMEEAPDEVVRTIETDFGTLSDADIRGLYADDDYPFPRNAAAAPVIAES